MVVDSSITIILLGWLTRYLLHMSKPFFVDKASTLIKKNLRGPFLTMNGCNNLGLSTFHAYICLSISLGKCVSISFFQTVYTDLGATISAESIRFFKNR
jgi:hypothetical protein